MRRKKTSLLIQHSGIIEATNKKIEEAHILLALEHEV